MILVLQTSKIVDGQLLFDLPRIQLDDKPEYEFRILSAYISFTKPVFSNYISLRSNWIDKSTINPKQDLIFLTVSDGDLFANYQPTHIIRYKMKLRSIQDSFFALHSFGAPLKNIDFVSVQAEVVTYGRL